MNSFKAVKRNFQQRPIPAGILSKVGSRSHWSNWVSNSMKFLFRHWRSLLSSMILHQFKLLSWLVQQKLFFQALLALLWTFKVRDSAFHQILLGLNDKSHFRFALFTVEFYIAKMSVFVYVSWDKNVREIFSIV